MTEVRARNGRVDGVSVPDELLALAVDLAATPGNCKDSACGRPVMSRPSPLPAICEHVDRECERLIVDRLAESRPNDSILAEEARCERPKVACAG